MEHFKNKKQSAPEGRFFPTADSEELGSRRLAGGIEGPVAVEADHTPFDAMAVAGEATILDDRVMQGVEFAIVELHGAAAIAARDIVGLPRPERDLMDVAIGHDSQLRIPEGALLFLELRGDGAERPLALRDPAVIARAEQPEVEFQWIGRPGGVAESQNGEQGADGHPDTDGDPD